ncbi:MAG: DNA starvation/stationary phase protection protein Dps [Dehalococcoidia bacterium]|nr:DNA starvation/stationary phase protection protein Dps [Dehalococcoidia bacterium]
MTTATKSQIDKKTMVDLLNEHVATAGDLASQLKQAHWAIVGENFIALHELFDRQVDLVRGYVDEYAERVRALGGETHGTVRAAARNSRLEEFEGGRVEQDEVVRRLVDRFERYSGMLSESIHGSDEANDLTSQDIFIGVQREIDRHAWFLRSHLE